MSLSRKVTAATTQAWLLALALILLVGHVELLHGFVLDTIQHGPSSRFSVSGSNCIIGIVLQSTPNYLRGRLPDPTNDSETPPRPAVGHEAS